MTTQPTFSTNKIIMAVVFISAALITSLFVFHMSHQSPASPLAAENGVLFPIARDIRPFELVSANKQVFSEKNLVGHWSLVFFGFTHCASICPTTMEKLSRTYSDLLSIQPNVQVILISLDPERDSVDVLKQYVTAYHPDFVGVSGKIQNLRKLQSDFGIFAARDEATPDGNYQLQHTASLFLVNPQGKLAGMFSNDMTPSQLAAAFKESVGFLSPQMH